MNSRWTIILVVVVVVVVVTAGIIFAVFDSWRPDYQRKTIDGVECIVDRSGRSISCNWEGR